MLGTLTCCFLRTLRAALAAASTSAVKTPRKPAPHRSTRGDAGGHFELVLDGHSSSPANTGYLNPSSFQIVSAGPSPLECDYSGAHTLYQDVMIV